MKTTKFITTLGLVTLALAACNNDDEITGGDKLPEGAVHITAHIEGVQTRAPQLDANGKGNFAQGDVWGMYAYTDTDAPGENMEYKYQETVLYWKDLSETSPVTFSAYYPRITESIANPAAYLYMPEEWNKTDDLLHATVTASKDGTVALTFKHLMHRLIVNLIAGEGMTGVDLSSALINSTAKDNTPTMFAKVEINLLTGTVNYDRVEDGLGLSNGGSGNADWKVAPQNLTAGAEWLRIKVDEDTWYYNVPANLNSSNPEHPTRLESGKQLTLNLTLKKNQQTGQAKVELTGSEISGWGNGEKIEDDVVIGGGDTPTGIATFETLSEAIANATAGTAENPTLITLDGDINITSTLKIPANKHLQIEGAGQYKLVPKVEEDINIIISDDSSLKLTNITLDGKNTGMDIFLYAGDYANSSAVLTLGEGFKLTNYKSYISGFSGIYVSGKLIVENGAEITGNGSLDSDMLIQLNNSSANVQLNGGNISNNKGIGILASADDYGTPAITLGGTLDASTSISMSLYDYLNADGNIEYETVITAAGDYTITKSDVAKFSIKKLNNGLEATDYELYLDASANAIKLRKTE